MDKILYPQQAKYIQKFSKVDTPLISRMEAYAGEHRVPILNRESAGFIEQLIEIKNPEKVLEIGTAIAYTTIRIAGRLAENCRIDTIEKSSDNVPLAKQNIEASGFESKINLLEGEALDIIPRLSADYDIIFLDADKEDYIKLFEVSLPLLKTGGIYIVDNLLWHGFTASDEVTDKYKNSTGIIREFNEIFMNHEELKTSLIPIGDGLGLGIKTGKIR